MADNSAWLPVIKARIQDRSLLPLTNEANETESGSTTVDDAILQVAIDDAIGKFQLYVRIKPVVDNAIHIPLVVAGTQAILLGYKQPSQSRQQHDKFRYDCYELKDQLSHAPQSTTTASAPDPTRGGTETIYRDSDRARFSGYLPKAPRL